ncbi:hypothetical protein WN71_009995 [Streptomyces mangrovisoli]|uniref:DUF3592 domain-containing protein n=1 Tax=Streptomyces mangrovisoli TaxID=1428628 RepID=A0A1J4P053_9ACTN|nr:hypothetical protein WN71_009995 [Streptomyces mangrovisoli]
MLVALAAGRSLAGEVSGARRIDASPVRVQGAVDRIVPVKGGRTYRVSYEVDGKHYTTGGLPVGSHGTAAEPSVGTTLCLEAAARHPSTARLCGQRYPGGDDMIATEGLIVLAGTVVALMALTWHVVYGRPARPAPAAVTRRRSAGRTDAAG